MNTAVAKNTDDFRDLTEDEADPDDNGKGKKKEPKQPKPEKQAKTQAENGQKEQAKGKEKKESKKGKKNKADKKKKGGKVKLILILVLVILVGGIVFVEFINPELNMLGLRDLLVENVVKLDPAFVSAEERQVSLDTYEAETAVREAAVASREAQVDRRRADLDAREAELRDRELKLIPIYRRIMTAQEADDMESLSRTYSMMSPEAAAEIFDELYAAKPANRREEVAQDIAAILYHMTERSAAAVLSAMDAELAAEITLILLYE